MHAILTFRSHQARGKLRKVESEVRALLNLLRENEAEVRNFLATYQDEMRLAGSHFTILDPELGDEELIQSWAAELAKLCR